LLAIQPPVCSPEEKSNTQWGDREVNEGAPDHGEDHPDAELRAIGDSTRDQGDGDDREHGLECDEGHHRVDTRLVVEGDLGGGSHEAFET
jgi:hypothetical protein